MKISVIGTGYVGLVTGTCFAEMGNSVTCVDVDVDKVEMLRRGEVPIYEPDLDKLIARNIRDGRLAFVTDLAECVSESEVIFLALPTPPNDDGAADLSQVLDVAQRIGPLLEQYAVVVAKSTVPVGTAARITECIARSATVEFDVVANPEFLREGMAVMEFMKPDRVVIGTESARAITVMQALYKPFVRQGNPIYLMDSASAEMTKYAANAFLATKISFMNEIANLCERVGADVDAVRLALGSDQRIGNRFLFAGIGYGGSCFPKDVRALCSIATENEYDFEILQAVQRVNAQQRTRLIEKILTFYGDSVVDRRFALWGLAFKPDTDDIREAPALDIVRTLIDCGAHIAAYDPQAMGNARAGIGENTRLTFGHDAYEVVSGADALVIATEWSVFRSPDWGRIKQAIKHRVVFDGRNLFDVEEMRREGFHYESIGRRVVSLDG